MLVFGIDIPLVEVLFTLVIVIFVLLVESVIVIILLMKEMKRTRKLGELIEKLSDTILQIKRAEIEELDKLRK